MTIQTPPIKPLSFGERLQNWLIAPSESVTRLDEKRQAQLGAGITLALLVVNVIGVIGSYSAGPDSSTNLLLNIYNACLIIAYFLTRTRFYTVGAFITTISSSLLAYSLVFFRAGLNEGQILNSLYASIPVAFILAFGILPLWGASVIILSNVLFIAVMPFFIPGFSAIQASTVAGNLFTMGALLLVVIVYRASTERQRLLDLQKTNQELEDVRTNLETRVAERTQELNRRSSQLEASTLVARAAASVHDLNTLLSSVVEQITERFGFYHAGIFLVDSTGHSMSLQAASSDGGNQMIAHGFKMEIGREGVVGYAAYQKRPRIVQDVTNDVTFLNIAELAQTRSEVALPLLVRNRLIGVLDIQAEESQAFTLDDLSTLQTMADQIALAIDNATLLEESRATLQQLELLNITNTANAWRTRMAGNFKGYKYTPVEVVPLAEETPKPISNSEKTIYLPLRLRGKTIGNICLRRKENDASWMDTEREMAERITAQIALAIENARLLEESQRRAVREQTVNEFSNRFNRSLDVDALLQNAVRELHRLPHTAEVSVFISPEKEPGKAK